MNLQPLLSAVRERTTHRGISTAAPFLREIAACLGGVCPSKVLGDVSAEAWATMLKEAESRLVYHADDMQISPKSKVQSPESETLDLGSWTLDHKASDGNPLPSHTIATFPAIITTTRQDRDGDVLETKGAELDPAAPLLWQHLPTEPIGRLLKEGKRTKSSLMGHFAIAGTALGSDAALLAEHGALRISHGFLPDEFEPLDENPGAPGFSGFHITRFKILEVSLVSVPSNPDAVITQFSREKLSHPLVKAWAGAMFEARPAVAAVEFQVSSSKFQVDCLKPETSNLKPETLAVACVCGAKVPKVKKKKKDPPTQWCIKMLKKSLGHCAAIAANPDATTLIADEATKAQGHIQDVIETMDPNNKVRGGVVSGPVVPHHSPLTTHPSPTKSGRVFSAANEKKLRAAAAHYKAIAHDDEAHPEVAGLADKGHKCIKGLFDTGGDAGDGQDDMDAYTVNGGSADGGGKNGHGGHPGKGKSGRAISAKHTAVIQEAIEHGKAIKSHDQATPGHKSMAKTAVKKLRSVLASGSQIDPNNDMNYGGGSGAPNGMAPDASGGCASFSATTKGMVALAMSRFAATDDLADLKAAEKALRKARKRIKDTITRVERQRQYDDESAALAAIAR